MEADEDGAEWPVSHACPVLRASKVGERVYAAVSHASLSQAAHSEMAVTSCASCDWSSGPQKPMLGPSWLAICFLCWVVLALSRDHGDRVDHGADGGDAGRLLPCT